jgi:hypothetical protein
MVYQHWFVSRQKRKLTSILPILVTFSDICVGKKWSGNRELQLQFEDALQNRNITMHGNLRARRAKEGGGGIRTLFKQMKDLGLVFTEDGNNCCRLTLISEELVKGNIKFVEAMRVQLQRYQYPSAACWLGSGSVDHSFKIHPFQFMFRLLRDERLCNRLSMEEMAGIVIHYAKSDSEETLNKIIDMICMYRENGMLSEFRQDTSKKKYNNIANTFFNYISLTQYVDRGQKIIMLRHGKEADIDAFIQDNPRLIQHPELAENYIRAYGRGNSSRDLRNFEQEQTLSQNEINEARIREEYVLLALKTPITGITEDVIEQISNKTGIDEGIVERYLVRNYPHGNIDDFFVAYKELAYMGRNGARDFELATCEMFRKIFKMRAKHIGPIGNTPDVLVESDEERYCGIIDNKAYKNGYSISGAHKRVMEDVYIPKVNQYGETNYPLAFFSYIAGSFGSNINSQLEEIHADTSINGSAMPVDLLIDLAQDYANVRCDQEKLKDIFSVNREVRISDIRNCHELSSNQ